MPARILVLDDEPIVAEVVARVLEEAEYKVDRLTDVLSASALIQTGNYDLVITNSVMTSPSGARFLARLHQDYPSLRLLHMDDQSHPRTTEFPADVPSIRKPFNAEMLLGIVSRLLAA